MKKNLDEKENTPKQRTFAGIFILSVFFFASACSFDYGDLPPGNIQPDITMRDVEYTRVREGNPQIHFKAELAERYEQRQTMKLSGFSFEQYNRGGGINAAGSGGSASVDLNSGDIQLEGGISISIESEDITIETPSLSWRDKERILLGSEKNAVQVIRSDGTSFSGSGFSADARSRTWSFSLPVEGIYIHEDTGDEAGTGPEEAESGPAGPAFQAADNPASTEADL
ncbi:MAG: LPS export ABC transporter periplasmic protein LptC [Treponema sp.]|jgi:LPS export ABC transporter protein LptC|nr:LPS export ABC transporter periplasmic protein LptC [Treponema sp.]